MKQKKILIADDNEHVRESLASILEDEGYALWIAKDGAEALKKTREVSPDILILDVMMPKMNGYEVCQTIKSDPDLKKTFVLMLSAKGQETERDRGKEVGADEYFVKPFNPNELVARIKNALEDR
jgi:two-component system alkaline phosphatase synthesis response regulator PhoP